jgi:fumarate hydratase class I
MKPLTLPLKDRAVRNLQVGDEVSLSGVLVTGRDAAHRWLVDCFVEERQRATDEDRRVYQALRPLLKGGAIYHCGPVVGGLDTGNYRFVAAGPTTSIREEPYQGAVMRHFSVQTVIGKGGMGPGTLQACMEVPGVYLHAVGGAAALIARRVRRVLGVYKLEFGVPEALWVIEVANFTAVVTMDAHGRSLHDEVACRSGAVLSSLLA